MTLDTTIAGSLPEPAWLAEPEKLWPAWRLEGEGPERGKRDAVLVWLEEQEDAGIDVACMDVESAEKVSATIEAALEFVDSQRLLPCSNCGMAPLPRNVAAGKLRALADGASMVRKRLGIAQR